MAPSSEPRVPNPAATWTETGMGAMPKFGAQVVPMMAGTRGSCTSMAVEGLAAPTHLNTFASDSEDAYLTHSYHLCSFILLYLRTHLYSFTLLHFVLYEEVYTFHLPSRQVYAALVWVSFSNPSSAKVLIRFSCV